MAQTGQSECQLGNLKNESEVSLVPVKDLRVPRQNLTLTLQGGLVDGGQETQKTGAIFQIVCILSVVFVPKSAEEQELDEGDRPVEPSSSSSTTRQVYDSSRKGKKQSKKHR
ncbi:hypothetical protein BaRGS_00005200 [Batillaria attramentaria]|uniref:Uncharacterized protein n=1 Tax=Batillaria attramentaria TaxID=370345 RepID=A0ABD0LWW2_9CAEN